MTVDLAEEHSSANLATERLELETAERLRLEHEILYLQVVCLSWNFLGFYSHFWVTVAIRFSVPYFKLAITFYSVFVGNFWWQNKNQTLQENGEKLETELLCLKTADLNGTVGLENEEGFATDDSSSGSAYKQRYERASRELEYTKRRLQQQHHDDLEQLVALRKQLEKKVSMVLIRYK